MKNIQLDFIEKMKESNPELAFYLETYGLKDNSAGYKVSEMNKEDIISEYKLIQNKQSKLTRSQRDAIMSKISWMISKQQLTQEELL